MNIHKPTVLLYRTLRRLLFLSIIFLSVSGYSEIPDSKRLIGQYPFPGNVNNQSGTNYDGVLSGASIVITKRLDAIKSVCVLDGINDFSSYKAAITPFVTTWQTDGTNNVTIPLTGSGYDFTIDWGYGTVEIKTESPGNISHTYAATGIKTLSITPNILTGFPVSGPLSTSCKSENLF